MRSPIRYLLPGAIAVLAVKIQHVLANTEKVIFQGPQQLNVPLEHPTLEDLHLEALSPHHSSLRTHITAEFPTEESKFGKQSWYLLYRLKAGQRYEVRICWTATEPTSFRLETHELPAVFENPDLITSLAQYSQSRQPLFMGTEDRTPYATSMDLNYQHNPDELISTLFLQIYAKADYYTMNQTLMENVPPVFVDIILDPYIFNIIPRSLVPTAAYIILLAVGSWYLSRVIMEWICSIGTDQPNKKKKNS